MLGYEDLEKGITFILEGKPYEILEFKEVHRGRGGAVARGKIRNLITGRILEKTFHPSDEFEEAEVEKVPIKFLYSHRGNFYFCEINDSRTRFKFSEEKIGENKKFLIPNLILTGLKFQGEIVNIKLPIKLQVKVKEAPPSLKGERVQGGTKPVILENGMEINVPSFIEEGDVIEINTETQEYVRRILKKE